MPRVNIRIAGNPSHEQSARIAAEIANTLGRVAHKPASYLTFDELPDEMEDCGQAGR